MSRANNCKVNKLFEESYLLSKSQIGNWGAEQVGDSCKLVQSCVTPLIGKEVEAAFFDLIST